MYFNLDFLSLIVTSASLPMRLMYPSVYALAVSLQIQPFPYTYVLPFLAEHVQPSDQMLVLGCGTELPLQLSRDGYGTR